MLPVGERECDNVRVESSADLTTRITCDYRGVKFAERGKQCEIYEMEKPEIIDSIRKSTKNE